MSKNLIIEILQIDTTVYDLNVISGGVVSSITGMTRKDSSGPPEKVIKHTIGGKDLPMLHGTPLHERDRQRMLAFSEATHHLDYLILSALSQRGNIRVPTVLEYYPEDKITVMTHFAQEGFTFLQDLLVEGKIIPSMGDRFGAALALLVEEFVEISAADSTLVPIESSETQFEERFDEMRVVLGYYKEFKPIIDQIIARVLSIKQLIPTDTHPKNMADDGEQVMFFDFGRTVYGDPQFVAPNFAAHIGLAILGGALPVETGIEIISRTIRAYNQTAQTLEHVEFIQEQAFVEYFLAELLHRGLGTRWIDARIFKESDSLTATEVKDRTGIAVQLIAKQLFRKKNLKIEDLFVALREARVFVESFYVQEATK